VDMHSFKNIHFLPFIFCITFPWMWPPRSKHSAGNCKKQIFLILNDTCADEIIHHHVHEGLGVFPVPWSSKWNWSLHFFLGRPTFLRPFVLYCNACFGILFVFILCTCCSHFSWYCFISRGHQNTHKILKRKKQTDTIWQQG